MIFTFRNQEAPTVQKSDFLTTTLNNQLLLDERGLGFDIMRTCSSVQLRFFASSVLYEFSREGRTCISKSTFVKRETGEKKPDSFSQYFWGTQLSFIIGGGSSPAVKAEDDEFSDIDTTTASRPFSIDVLYYGEGLDYAKNRRHFAALHNEYFFKIIDYHFETALQYYKRYATVGYIGGLSRNFFMGKAGIIKPFVGYTGYNCIKGHEAFAPSFSNMFLSDRMQYLTLDNQIIFGGITYRPFERMAFEIADYQKTFIITLNGARCKSYVSLYQKRKNKNRL